MSRRRLISFDWAMKKLLRSKENSEILEGFLSELLGDNIKILEVLDDESKKQDIRCEFNRIDLNVENDKKELIIIEIQYDREFDYLQRIHARNSNVITEHVREDDPCSKVAKVISINILTFDFGHGNDYIYHGTTTFKGLHNQDPLLLFEEDQALYEKSKIHDLSPEYYFIKADNFNDTTENTLDEWVYFLKNGEIKEEFTAKGIKKAKLEFDKVKLSDEEYQTYERYLDDLHYQASMVESSYTLGFIEGKEKGLAKVRIAIKLLISGSLDIGKISEITGLSIEELRELEQKHTPQK